MATILQAYTGASDDEVIEATTMDRRWQLVLDCLDCTEPPFSKGTLVGFRQCLIAQHLDRRLIERTIELAAQVGAFGSRQLRAALDSSPLWGAGRVEDTYNLLSHALLKRIGYHCTKAWAGADGHRHGTGADHGAGCARLVLVLRVSVTETRQGEIRCSASLTTQPI